MSTDTQAVLAQVSMIAGVIEAACVAILRARVTGGPMADIDTAEVMAKLRMAKRSVTEGASMLQLQVSLDEAMHSDRMAEELSVAKEEASQQATRAEAAEAELRELSKRTQEA